MHCARLVAIAIVFADAYAASVSSLHVKDGVNEFSDKVLLLNLGNLAAGQTRLAILEFSWPADLPAREKRDIWVFCEGRYVVCRWDDGQRTDSGRRMDLPQKLKVSFVVPPAETDPITKQLVVKAMPALIFISDARREPLMSITIDYQLFLQDRIAHTFKSGSYASGIGKNFGPWYPLCSGPAISGYEISHHVFNMSGDDGRGCYSWGECSGPTKSPDKGVCYQFTLQGKEAEFPDGHEVKRGSATLAVTWSLITTKPTLSVIPKKP